MKFGHSLKSKAFKGVRVKNSIEESFSIDDKNI